MAKDNALSFVGQIMTAYNAVMKAEGQALKYAIECGEATSSNLRAGRRYSTGSGRQSILGPPS